MAEKYRRARKSVADLRRRERSRALQVEKLDDRLLFSADLPGLIGAPAWTHTTMALEPFQLPGARIELPLDQPGHVRGAVK